MMLNVGELIVRLTPRAFPINCVNVVLPAPKSPLSKSNHHFSIAQLKI